MRARTALLTIVLGVALVGCSSGDDAPEDEAGGGGVVTGDAADGDGMDDGGAGASDADADEGATGTDDGAGSGSEDGDVVVLDGTRYAVTSVSCSLDQYVEGDAAVNADLEGGGEARVAYSPDLEPAFQELEVRVDDETWSLFSGDSHDTLTVSVEGAVVDASGEVGPFAGGSGGGDLVEASVRVTCP